MRTWIVLSTVCFLAGAASAQSHRIWSGGQFSPAAGNGVAVDAANNIFVASTIFSGDRDMRVSRHDALGAETWARAIDGGAGMDYLYDVAVDGAGNVVACGFVDSGISTTYHDAWIGKYDSAGNALWSLTYSSPGAAGDACQGIALDSQGNIVMAGYYQNGDLLTGWAAQNFWVQKLDDAGAVVWSRTYDDNALADSARDVVIDSGDNIIVTGYVTHPTRGLDVYTQKFDSAGTLLWSRRYDGPASGAGDDFGTAVTVDTADNVIVTGADNAADLVQRCFVRKYAADGLILWTRRFRGGIGGARCGGIVAVGTDMVLVGTTTEAVTGDDIFLRRYDADGNLVWEEIEATAGDDHGGRATRDGDGNVVATGYLGGNGLQIWLGKYNPDTTMMLRSRSMMLRLRSARRRR